MNTFSSLFFFFFFLAALYKGRETDSGKHRYAHIFKYLDGAPHDEILETLMNWCLRPPSLGWSPLAKDHSILGHTYFIKCDLCSHFTTKLLGMGPR